MATVTNQLPVKLLDTSSASPEDSQSNLWLFSAPIDITVFLGSAIVSLLALYIGSRTGILYEDTPDWAWISFVLLIDVAHVYATNFRVYFDKEEFKRRWWLYTLVPLLGYIFGVTLYSESDLLFWKVLAYLAVFHFVRQQYGWVTLYRARKGEHDRFGLWVDNLTIYIATIYPLIYWHTHLPRKFWWLIPNDFGSLPILFEQVFRPIYYSLIFLYISKSLYGWILKREGNPGKDIVVVTTIICWYVGIVYFNSDYAFTVTNVIIHGLPYLALTYWYARKRRNDTNNFYKVVSSGPIIFLLTLWLLAYMEELFWDRYIWHERSWLFGANTWDSSPIKMFIVPLLALPQLTHYILDGFIWRRKNNPDSFLSS
jgi:hypothetical protein